MSEEQNDNNLDFSSDRIEARKRIVMEITGKFKPERYVYLIVAILSFALIVFVAVDLYTQKKIDMDQLAIFIGPTGFLAYAVSRILYMWSKSIKIIFTGKF